MPIVSSTPQTSSSSSSSPFLSQKDDIVVQQPNISVIFLRMLWKFIQSILLEKAFFWYLFIPLLIFELLLNALIIWKVPYTEIDWIAYMQEVGGFLAGERDYKNLEGDTGPLVYPAGFIYIYSLLSMITSSGRNIQLAQIIFAMLYISTFIIACFIYKESKHTPPYVIIFLSLSRRLHSIYVLRLFNDCWAMLFLYSSVLCLVRRKWILASILYSIAVSVKMNILLFAPAFALIMFKAHMWKGALLHGFIILFIQIFLGIPFLIHSPRSYLTRSFEFSRTFMYKWSVNWKFLPEEVFSSPSWKTILLWAHILTLLGFLLWHWCRREGGFTALLKSGFGCLPMVELYKQPPLSPDHMIHLMFTCNFVGVVFSRSLHFQFYSWYFMTLPYLLWRSRLPVLLRILLLLTIEICWNIYPSTSFSSIILSISHLIVLSAIVYGDGAVDRKEEIKILEDGFDLVNKHE